MNLLLTTGKDSYEIEFDTPAATLKLPLDSIDDYGDDKLLVRLIAAFKGAQAVP
jgi:hypothetical protein